MKRILGNIRGMNALELLVVIALIGVFVGFLFPTMSRARMHVKVAETKMMMSQVSIALEMYHADYHIYPDTLESLDAIGISIETLPKDPFNPDDDYFQYYTNKYAYKGSTYTARQLFMLDSYGPDGDDDVEGARPGNDGFGWFSDISYNYDSSVYQFYEDTGDQDPDRFSLDATVQPGYENGDLILFAPLQPLSLKEVNYDNGFGFIPWSSFGF